MNWQRSCEMSCATNGDINASASTVFPARIVSVFSGIGGTPGIRDDLTGLFQDTVHKFACRMPITA